MRAIAWLGGLAFAASLAYLAYFYAVVLASPAGDAARAAGHAAFDAGLFAVFAAHHSLLARAGLKSRLARVIPAGLERTVYVIAASALLAAVCLLWRPVPGTVYEAGGVLRAALYGVQVVGVLLTIRSASLIDPLELAGIRPAAAPAPDAIRIAGPFRMVRHPIYLGWLLMLFGAPSMTMNRLLFAGISSAYLILAIPWEERSLVAAHGDRYRAYQQAVRWRLIPGLW